MKYQSDCSISKNSHDLHATTTCIDHGLPKECYHGIDIEERQTAWIFACLSAEQQEVVVNFVAGRDVFISLPTGAGKSLCYLVLPSIFNLLRNSKYSMVIVACLLKSLIEDQAASLVPRF